jgi:hypothetical protein
MFINHSLEPHVTDLDQKLWGKVMMLILETAKYVQDLPKLQKPGLNCHSLCRALAHCVSEVKVVDGLYLGTECHRNGNPNQVSVEIRNCTHSWLVTPDEAIIDPYPVGIIITNPILIGPKGPRTVFGYQMYFPNPEITNRVVNRTVWRESIVLAKCIKAGMAARHACAA